MFKLEESSVFAHSADDVKNYETKNSTGVSNAQEDTLTAYWLKLRKEVESSNKTPNKVVRRVLAHLRMRMVKSNAVQTETGVSPLNHCPEEMWYEILKHISAPDDLISCARTCTLLKTIVQKMKTEKFFGVALPHIANYLSHKELLKCRLVCKQWNVNVRSIANTESRCNEPPQNECKDLEVANYLHKVRKGTDEQLTPLYDDTVDDNNDNISPIHYLRHNSRFFKMSTQELLTLQPKNPFVGGRVFILLEGLRKKNEPGYLFLILQFLDQFGSYLTSLQLSIRETIMHFHDAYLIVAQVFKKCPNLRSFWIPNNFHANIQDNLRDSIVEDFSLPDHSCIRYIDIGGEIQRDILLPLLYKYSSQLCRLNLILDVEGTKYLCTLPWENLTELRVDSLSTPEITTLLRRLKAPQLRHMSVWFIPFYNSLQNILETVNSFPKLTSLHIDMVGVRLGVEEMDIISVPTDTVLRSSITSLEITLGDLSISLDFLVCFPFVKYLVIHYPSHKSGRFDRDELIAYARKSVVGKGKLVHLFEHLGGGAGSGKSDRGRESCLYKSNIWEILRFLQTVQFTGPKVFVKIRNVLTRSGYKASRYCKT